MNIIVGFLGTRFRALHRRLKIGTQIRHQIHRFRMEQSFLSNSFDRAGLQVRSY